MPQFTKKPVTIEAVQFLGAGAAGGVAFEGATPPWLDEAMGMSPAAPGSAWAAGILPFTAERADCLAIDTLEGVHFASPGDWIIRGVKGELCPCKPDIFEATYRSADPVDYAKMLPGDMLAAMGTDGMAWADAFGQIACEANPLGRALRDFPHTPKGNERDVLDGVMLGWFCNAIEVGRAAGEQAVRRRLYPLFVEAVICEPGDSREVIIRYASARDARAAHAALVDLGRDVGIVGATVATEGEAREALADGFGREFDEAALTADFQRGAGENGLIAADPAQVSALPPSQKQINDLAWVARQFIDKHQVSCVEDTPKDGVYEEAPLLVEQLAEIVGYWKEK